jgi:hypothetical protein
MNDEYLWQKTGDDDQITRLEEALAVFRYRESDPPAVTVLVGRSWIRRWRLPYAVAVASFAALLFVAGIWFNLPGRGDDDVTFIYHPSTTQNEVPAEIQLPAPKQELQPPAVSPVRRTNHQIQSTTVSTPRRAVTRTPKTRTVVLTKEEREAYEQVLLALSISSSKINIVRDTINGVDQKDIRPEVNNR